MNEQIMHDMAKLLGEDQPRIKDVSPHFIKPLDKATLDRAAVSADGPDSSVFIRDCGVHNADLTGRVRHRATMLRQRADELDELADLYEGVGLQQLRAAVESYDEQTFEIEALLRSYAHVNPTKVS